ncbi:MAG TPA: hypothetical protein VGG63_06905 [Steroidobacteraceae bacterium]|jgi:hypothetical protein
MKTRLRFQSYSRRAKWVLYPTVAVVVINFAAFMAGLLYLGGDAMNGYVRAGHYFLCAHSQCVETSRAIWRYSYWHTLTALGGIALVIAETALFLNTGDIQFEAQG